MHQTITRHCLTLTIACTTAIPALTAAQNYPVKPITVVVSFAAGGNNDLRARQLGIPVGEMLGQPVIVENKAGASGNIGHDFVAHAPADGYVLGVGAMGPLAVNPSIYPKLNFDPLRDFTPILLIEKAPMVLVTRTEKPFRSVKDVVEAAKAKPESLTIGMQGPAVRTTSVVNYSSRLRGFRCWRCLTKVAGRHRPRCWQAKST